jgi:predicted amidophosphoribosyltransferase
MTDPLEDLLAFLFTSGKLSGAKPLNEDDSDDSVCPNCGADLEYDDSRGCRLCPVCNS